MAEENLDQKILAWLNTQGYGLEMQVARGLNAAGFDILQSSFYNDPEKGTSREIDVIGRMSDEIGLLYIYAVIECKKSSKPWIVFTSDNAGYNRIWSFAIMTNNAGQAIINNLDRMLEIDWFKKKGRLGYEITEAFSSKEDETFKAGMSATKAAISLVKKETTSLSSDFLSFLFPTVVLDGRLFESYLEQDGNPVVNEIDSAFLLFPIRIGDYNGSAVRIVTIKAFDRYCTEINSVFNSLKNILSAEMKEIAKSIGMPDQDRGKRT